MKKIFLILGIAISFLIALPNCSFAEKPSTIIVPTPEQTAKAKSLLLRLDEINNMDKSNLDACDKKELRIEVRSISRCCHHYCITVDYHFVNQDSNYSFNNLNKQ